MWLGVGVGSRIAATLASGPLHVTNSCLSVGGAVCMSSSSICLAPGRAVAYNALAFSGWVAPTATCWTRMPCAAASAARESAERSRVVMERILDRGRGRGRLRLRVRARLRV